MANPLEQIKQLKNWVNSEKFPASAYNYERNVILKAIETIEGKLQVMYSQKVLLSVEEPDEEIREGDIWLDA